MTTVDTVTRAHTANGNGRAVVASAAKIRIDDEQSVRKVLALREDWQSAVWDYFDAVGELKHAAYLVGDALSRVRLYAAEMPADPTETPEPTTNPTAVAALARLNSGVGIPELMRSFGVQFTVPGACWLIGLAPRQRADLTFTPERWWVASLDDLQSSGGRTTVIDPETGEAEKLYGEESDDRPEMQEPDFWARIWRPHPRKSAKADSPARGVMEACEDLLVVGRYFRSVTRSRIWTGKIVLIPKDWSDGPTDPTTESAGDGEAMDDPLNQELMDAATAPIQDEGSAAAVAPIVLRYPRRPDQPHGLEVVDLERTADELMLKWGEAAQHRFAQGINLPVELVFGLGEANHWGAGQIEESAFRQYLEPTVVLAVAGITKAYYREALRADGVPNPEDYLVWFDASDLVVDKERKGKAMEAHDRFLISDAAARAELRYSEEDAPSDDELERRLAVKRSILTGDLSEELLRRTIAETLIVPHLTPAGVVVDTPTGDTQGEPIEQPTSEAIAAAVATAEIGERLAAIDRDLYSRLETFLDGVIRRAVERAGSRLRSKARSDRSLQASIASTPACEVGQTLGRAVVAALLAGASDVDLIADTIDEAAQRFARIVADAQRAALRLVPNLTSERHAEAEADQRDDRADAWAAAREQLIEVAVARLYGPAADEQTGEQADDIHVPFAIVREAAARAGGAGRAGADALTAAGFLRGLARAFGVGTGYLLRALLAESSVPVMVAGYRWEYGAFPRREFPPHRALDGVEFEHFDDPVLVNSTGWPAEDFYTPGDHNGCKCSVVPITIEVGR